MKPQQASAVWSRSASGPFGCQLIAWGSPWAREEYQNRWEIGIWYACNEFLCLRTASWWSDRPRTSASIRRCDHLFLRFHRLWENLFAAKQTRWSWTALDALSRAVPWLRSPQQFSLERLISLFEIEETWPAPTCIWSVHISFRRLTLWFYHHL